MSGAQDPYRRDDPARGLPDGRVRDPERSVAAVAQPEEDADLAAAVRSTTRMRTAFYVVVLLIALGGQVSGAMEALDMPWYVALPAVGALELGGMVVLANADVRRRLGEHATLSRLLSAGIAGGAVAFNWLAHSNHLEGGFYGGMSLLGYLVWLMNTENKRRDRLRAKRQLPPTPPAYEFAGHWLRHPLLTRRARTLAKAAPALGLYGSLDAARTQVRTERRQAALAKVLRRKIRRALDGTTADIAVAVYDLDEIARRLAERADYDGLTALIAADLSPARVLAGNLPAARRRWWRRRGATPDAVELASAGRLLSDALSAPDPSGLHPEHRPTVDAVRGPLAPALEHPGPLPALTEAPAVPDALAPSATVDTRLDPPDVAARRTVPSDVAAGQPVPLDAVAGSPDGTAGQSEVAAGQSEVAAGQSVKAEATAGKPGSSAVRVESEERATARVSRANGRGDRANGRTHRVADRANGRTDRADRVAESVDDSAPDGSGRGDSVERPEPVRPRWDALTAEVSAIFSTSQRRPARTGPEREPAPARPASTGVDVESDVDAEPEPAPEVGSEIAAPGGPVPVVPITERPLPDLVAAAATRTLAPAQVAAMPAADPVRAARGVAPVPAPGEGSLRSRVHALLDAMVSADDERDNSSLTDLAVRELQLTPAERGTAAKYVRTWRAEAPGRRTSPGADRGGQ
ncbi:hypothetical protein BDK92_0324 [Micromonospora pisi]|uniref:Uncharacterized protein n=1 Tax=Micromonospora pisi TaxID=589240 RepID=A0A495JB84_9ACTN|nr:hypothetical protein [Micromonospora pisi]RKR86103.1 hypothetical protein BDK92_0324 [Micromonospora pisi]